MSGVLHPTADDLRRFPTAQSRAHLQRSEGEVRRVRQSDLPAVDLHSLRKFDAVASRSHCSLRHFSSAIRRCSARTFAARETRWASAMRNSSSEVRERCRSNSSSPMTGLFSEINQSMRQMKSTTERRPLSALVLSSTGSTLISTNESASRRSFHSVNRSKKKDCLVFVAKRNGPSTSNSHAHKNRSTTLSASIVLLAILFARIL